MGIFADCTALTSITIPENIRYITTSAFENCTSLQEIVFTGDAPNIDEAFAGVMATVRYPCNNATWTAEKQESYGGELTWEGYFLPAEVVESGSCGAALNWTLYDDGLLVISGSGAMEDYQPLRAPWNSWREDITTLEICEGVTAIGEYAFRSCENLAVVSLPETLREIGAAAFGGCKALTKLVLPEGLTTLGSYVFTECSGLAELCLPDSVAQIGSGLFSGCTALKTVTIPEGVTALSSCTFEECTSLETVYLPASLESMGTREFYQCTSLTGIWVAEDSGCFSNDENGVLFDRDKTVLVACPGGYQGEYRIPETVTALREEAFQTCRGLTQVDLPAGLTAIGESAFAECASLESITVPDGVTELPRWFLADCESLTEVTLHDSITVIGSGAFAACSALEEIDLPAGLTVLEGAVFSDCDALKALVIPDGVTTVGPDLCSGCWKLERVWFPDSVTELDYGAFLRCEDLTEVRLPSGLTEIPAETFMYCSDLTVVEIPETVTRIGMYAFRFSALQQIELPAGVTEIGHSAFEKCPLTEIRIPAAVSKIDDYAFRDCVQMAVVRFEGGAPEIGTDIFAGVTAIAYYPAGSWSESELQDYGGDITWVPYGSSGETTEPMPFQDVPADAYYYEAVLWAVENGITAGYGTSGTLFAPDINCTRAQVVTFLWRAAGSPAPTTSENPFKDVSETDWYYTAVLWAAENGITAGYGAAGDQFRPDLDCTRAQVVTFLHRAAGEEPPVTEENPFNDVDESSWYYEAVLWAVESGITAGYGSTGGFAPDVVCSRGQIVTFLYRAYN